jgi:membrane-associated phospholipid phosphatase
MWITSTAYSYGDSSHTIKRQLVPAGLILYGTAATYSQWGTHINQAIKKELYKPNQHTKVDDYLTLAPVAAVYGLNALGIKGKHNFKDRTVILGTAYLIAYPITIGVKQATAVLRPDGSTYNSFPSGHTAIAFASAEFLRQEYQDQSVWYGIAGYTAATAVAGLRMYNNRHWFSDVCAGAGVGILSTQVAAHVQPWLNSKIFKNNEGNARITPQIGKNNRGLSFSMTF